MAAPRLREAIDEGALAAAWAEGRQMAVDAAVAFAISGSTAGLVVVGGLD